MPYSLLILLNFHGKLSAYKKMENNDDKSFFSRLQQGLSKTRKGFVRNLDEMISGEKVISGDIFEDIEEILIGADLGP
ncbi:MAG: hypothetical protein KAT81_00780, partial [Syntrophobacterales bacterium]|nr:hypothetical protein [Syntrophobacterales bacterium]